MSGPSPHGEGGLKYTAQADQRQAQESLPTRGGWIEIHRPLQTFPPKDVPPHTGRVD